MESTCYLAITNTSKYQSTMVLENFKNDDAK